MSRVVALSSLGGESWIDRTKNELLGLVIRHAQDKGYGTVRRQGLQLEVSV